MRNFTKLAGYTAGLGALSLALAACGSSDDASSDTSAESVEVGADDALSQVTEEPVEDAEVAGPLDPSETAPDAATTNAAADEAATVAAEVEALEAELDAIEGLDVEDVVEPIIDEVRDQ